MTQQEHKPAIAPGMTQPGALISLRPRWLKLALPAFLWAGAAIACPRCAAQQPVDYMIVVTGRELLAGAYADGHTFFLTRTLRALGLHCVGSITVDDRQPDIQDALRFAKGKASLVIVTGGLGPTENDITRETLSDFTGIPLQEHPDVLREMERRFHTPRDKLRPNLRRQTMTPTRGGYLKNSNGTAVGLVFEMADTDIVALPGPPHELQPMVREELTPYLSRRFGTRLSGCSLTVRFVGVGQSQIDQTLRDHGALAPGIMVSSQFEGGRVDFTFSLPGDTPRDRDRLQDVKQVILEHLGDYVYATDETSLEQCVLKLLDSRGASLTLAEAGSGGSLAAGLNGADGANQVLAGAYVAPTEDKLRRMLGVPDAKWPNDAPSAEKTQVLAAAAADLTASPWAIAVGQAQPAEGGGRYVEAVFRSPDGRLESQRISVGPASDAARSRLVSQLLDQLRRRLR